MPYTVGVLRETLRLQPPGGGVPRYGPSDFMLAGYRIPAKMAVMMEPRIVNRDPNLYAEPLKFEKAGRPRASKRRVLHRAPCVERL